jgi:peptidoglycan/LPS O-acetylase OafA/YrhL
VTEAPTERGGEGAWAKLRRRKVVQWGLAYAGGAWALAQALAHLVTTYHWPEQIQQIGTLLLLIGLPIALILAWYHGDRGQQRVTGAELAVLSVLLALGGGVIWIYGQRYQPTPAAATVAKPSAIPPASEERPSIAVLPFENRS